MGSVDTDSLGQLPIYDVNCKGIPLKMQALREAPPEQTMCKNKAGWVVSIANGPKSHGC